MAIVNIGVGLAANDGSGDSIRDAFVKTNSNFAFLDAARQNLVTGNLTATGTTANVTFNTGRASYWTGTFYLNGYEIATTNRTFDGGTVTKQTLFTDPTVATSTGSGALQLTAGGLGVVGDSYFGNVFVGNLSSTYNLTTATVNSGSGTFTGAVSTGPLTITGASSSTGNIIVGNVSALSSNPTQRNVAAYYGFFQEVSGTVQTAAQPNITQLGSLISLSVTGNVTAANLIVGNINSTGNITTTSNLIVKDFTATGFGNLAGNLVSLHVASGVGTFANATVQDVPSNYHVTNKAYVNTTVIGFAIGLGS